MNKQQSQWIYCDMVVAELIGEVKAYILHKELSGRNVNRTSYVNVTMGLN